MGDWVDGLTDFANGSLPGCCSTADALVQERVREAGVVLTCYISGVTDQEDWRRKSEEN